MSEITYSQLTALQEQILVLLVSGREVCLPDLMDYLNKRRRLYGLPQITYGSFYPAVRRLELRDFVECIATYSLKDTRCRINLRIKELGKQVLLFNPKASVFLASH